MTIKMKTSPRQQLSKLQWLGIAGGSVFIVAIVGWLVGGFLLTQPSESEAINITFTAKKNGNWNSPSTWRAPGSGKTIPGKNDNVKIQGNNVKVKNSGIKVDSVILKGGSIKILQNGGITLGYLNMYHTSQNITYKYGNATTYNPSELDITKGKAEVKGSIAMVSGGSAPNNHSVLVENKGELLLQGKFADPDDGDLNVKKGGLLTLKGSQQQTLPGNSFATIHQLKINNTAPTKPQVKLTKDLSIEDSLILKNGVIASSDSTKLTLKKQSGIKGWNASKSYITGLYSRKGGNTDSLMFKVAKGNRTAKVAVHNMSQSQTYEVTYKKKDPNKQFNNNMASGSNLNFISEDEYWNIQRTSGSGKSRVSLFWDNQSPSHLSNINRDTNLVIAHYDTANNVWENLGHYDLKGNVNGKGHVTVKNVQSFSPFTFGSTDQNSPLPVELIAFKVQNVKDQAKLTWSTASETNNSHFKVQKSTSGSNFRNIGRVEGSGTTLEEQNYLFYDEELGTGTIYYRLKQVDHDGSSEYSNVKAIAVNDSRSNKALKALKIKTIAPNPFRNDFEVKYDLKKSQRVTVSLRNTRGATLYQRSFVGNEGINEFKYNEGHKLKRGAYILTIKGNQQQISQKLIKQ